MSSSTTSERLRSLRQHVTSVLRRLYLPICIGLLCAAFILQMLTSISVPTIKAADFLRFELAFGQFSLFGIWSICTGQPPLEFPATPWLNQPAQYTCSPRTLGWTDVQYRTLVDALWPKGMLPKALAMHPVACALTGLAGISAIVQLRRRNVAFPLLVAIAAAANLVAFIVDVVIFVPAFKKISNNVNAEATSTALDALGSDPTAASSILGSYVLNVNYGAGFWMALIAAALSLAALGLIILAFFGRRHADRRSQWLHISPTSSDRKAAGSYAESDKIPLADMSRKSSFLSMKRHAHSKSGASFNVAADKGVSSGVNTPGGFSGRTTPGYDGHELGFSHSRQASGSDGASTAIINAGHGPSTPATLLQPELHDDDAAGAATNPFEVTAADASVTATAPSSPERPRSASGFVKRKSIPALIDVGLDDEAVRAAEEEARLAGHVSNQPHQRQLQVDDEIDDVEDPRPAALTQVGAPAAIINYGRRGRARAEINDFDDEDDAAALAREID